MLISSSINYFNLAINPFIFIPSSENIFSCSVTIFLPSNISSLCKSYVFFNISKPESVKYVKLSLNNSSSSVLKYISYPGFKNSL